MTRKQLSQFSTDELRLLRWRFLEEKDCDNTRRTLKRINDELYTKSKC